MGKGSLTRQAILERAMQVATTDGLEGLTIGRLAKELDLSKSGLFAHFQSKEALQLQTIETAAARFTDLVVRPALAARRGEPRLRAVFDRWREWPKRDAGQGGCFFVAAASELDDRPGPARELLANLQRTWLDLIASIVRGAVTEGHFRADVDADQFAHDLYGVMLAMHHSLRLLDDPRGEAFAKNAFEHLVASARAPHA